MDTIKIVHCSDLHFGSQNQQTVWESFEHDVRTVTRPDLILITGDIAHTTDETLFKNAARTLLQFRNIGIPYYVCAGNHDRHPLGNAPDVLP